MRHMLFEDDDGNTVQAFDQEAIDYFIQALERLRDMEPGEGLSTPSIQQNDDGSLEAAQYFILQRLEDL